MGADVYGILENDISITLEEAYKFEHEEVDNSMFDYLIPFSPDGGGNHYCFDSRTIDEESCQVVFWQHDYSYTEVDSPEVTHLTFTSWIKDVLIDWTIEDFDYDGNPKSK